MLKTTKTMVVGWAILLFAVVLIYFPIVKVEASNVFRTEYEVKKGDTIPGISQRYGVDGELLAAMNNMGIGAKLYLGQCIYIPREPEVTYYLRPGDTLWKIAETNRIKVDYLLSYNNIANPDQLQIGYKLRIPMESPEEGPILMANKPKTIFASRGISSFILPVMGRISSNYGWRKSGFHHGTDIAATVGTPIRAAKAGTVALSGWLPIYGKTVIINHGQEMRTLYGHASELLVEKGQKVKEGETIAKVGETGRTTGPHVHFEVYINGKTVDPMRYLSKI